MSSSVFWFCFVLWFCCTFQCFLWEKRIDITNETYNLDAFLSWSLIFPINPKLKIALFAGVDGDHSHGLQAPATQLKKSFICSYYFFSSHFFFGGVISLLPSSSDNLNNVAVCKNLAFIITVCIRIHVIVCLWFFFIVLKDESYPGSSEKTETIQKTLLRWKLTAKQLKSEV